MEVISRSQLEQDIYVVKLFRQKRKGYFLDFGAFDGKSFSNTYVLEKDFGWSGICVEPLPSEFEKLKACRSVHCCNKALFAKSGEILEFAASDNSETIRAQTINPTDLLITANAPTEIDYMSLDTEGSELTILEAFDFDRYTVKFINVKHNYQEPRRSLMRDVLESKGYLYFGSVEFDDNYIHSSFFTGMYNNEYNVECESNQLWLSSSTVKKHKLLIQFRKTIEEDYITELYSTVFGTCVPQYGVLAFSSVQLYNCNYDASTIQQKYKFINHSAHTKCIQNVYIPESPFWGLGDYLRGSLSLAGICESLGLSFGLNYCQHPISMYLTNEQSSMDSVDFSKVPQFPIEDTLNLVSALKEVVKMQNNQNMLIPLTTNCWQLENGISDTTRNIMRKSLTPATELELAIKELQSILPSHEYNAVHIRMGDKYLIYGEQNEKLYFTFYTMIVSALPTDMPYILFSDDNNLKEYCKKKGMYVSPSNPCHLSSSSQSIAEKVKGTLSDFFCISRAKNIYKYSNHGYGSGFVDWCADIYGIPTAELLLPAPSGSFAYISEINSEVVAFTINMNNIKLKHRMLHVTGECHVNGKFYPYEFLSDDSTKGILFPNTNVNHVYNEKAKEFDKHYSYSDGVKYDKATTIPMIDNSIYVPELIEHVTRQFNAYNPNQHVWIVKPYTGMAEFMWPPHNYKLSEKVHFLSFASNDFAKTVRRLQHHAESSELFASVNAWTEQDIPEFIEKHSEFIEKNPRGFGYWTWKPYIIHKLLQTIPDGEFILYSDSGNSLNPQGFPRLCEYIELCKNSPYANLSLRVGSADTDNTFFYLKTFTKGDVLKYFSMNEPQQNGVMKWAGFWLLRACDTTRALVQEWVDLIPRYSLWDDSHSHEPNADIFIEHRHDQSIFSCLLEIYGTHSIENNESDANMNTVENMWKYPVWASRIK